MTLNRWLFLTAVLIGSMLGVLAFGSAQWKYSFMFQSYVWPANTKQLVNPVMSSIVSTSSISKKANIHESFPILFWPPDDFQGWWKTWDREGTLSKYYWSNNKVVSGDSGFILLVNPDELLSMP